MTQPTSSPTHEQPSRHPLTHDTVSRLFRAADESITGRARFEATTGRKSTKPLTQVEVDPHVMKALLARAFPESYGNR